MIFSFINGKGGAGKTTVTVTLALAFHEADYRVAVHDTDPQRTATRWLAETKAPVELWDPRGGPYNVVLVDTPPRLETREVREAIERADAVVLVTSPSPADLFTSQDTVAVIKAAGGLHKARVLFNQVQRGTDLSADLPDLAERIGLPALKANLHRRIGYQKSVLLGWAGLPADVRQDVRQLALELTGWAASIKT